MADSSKKPQGLSKEATKARRPRSRAPMRGTWEQERARMQQNNRLTTPAADRINTMTAKELHDIGEGRPVRGNQTKTQAQPQAAPETFEQPSSQQQSQDQTPSQRSVPAEQKISTTIDASVSDPQSGEQTDAQEPQQPQPPAVEMNQNPPEKTSPPKPSAPPQKPHSQGPLDETPSEVSVSQQAPTQERVEPVSQNTSEKAQFVTPEMIGTQSSQQTPQMQEENFSSEEAVEIDSSQSSGSSKAGSESNQGSQEQDQRASASSAESSGAGEQSPSPRKGRWRITPATGGIRSGYSPSAQPKETQKDWVRTYQEDYQKSSGESRSQPAREGQPKSGWPWKTTFAIIFSVLFLSAGAGLAYYSFFLATTERTAPTPPPPLVDAAESQTFVINNTRENILSTFRQEQNSQLASGSVTYLVPVKRYSSETRATSTTAFASPREVFSELDAGAPFRFTQSLEQVGMFGIYGNTSGNAPFIILKTQNQEVTLSGLLRWREGLMREFPKWFSLNMPDAESDIRTKVLTIDNREVRRLTASGGTTIFASFYDGSTLVITSSREALEAIFTRLTSAG